MMRLDIAHLVSVFGVLLIPISVCCASAPCYAQRASYLARYEAKEYILTPKGYWDARAAVDTSRMEEAAAAGETNAAAAIRQERDGELALENSIKRGLADQYAVTIGVGTQGCLYAVQSKRTNELWVNIYLASRDRTYRFDRLPNEKTDVWVERGLDTRGPSFVLLTGLDSPYIRHGASQAVLNVPLQAGPPYDEPGTVAKPCYIDADASVAGSETTVTGYLAPKSRAIGWVLHEGQPQTANGAALPQSISLTDYSTITSLADKSSANVVMDNILASFVGMDSADKIAEALDIRTWMQPHDRIIDNTERVQKIALYDANYGGIDQQLYSSPMKSTKNNFFVNLFLCGLALIAAALFWRFAARRERSTKNPEPRS